MRQSRKASTAVGWPGISRWYTPRHSQPGPGVGSWDNTKTRPVPLRVVKSDSTWPMGIKPLTDNHPSGPSPINWHLVTGEFPPAMGGVGHHTLLLAKGLADA